MTLALTASLVQRLLETALGSLDETAGNRWSLDALSWKATPEGEIELGIRKLEATGLRLAVGPLVLEVGRVAIHQLVGRLRTDAAALRLSTLGAAAVELSSVKLHGPVALPPVIAGTSGDAWQLAPLATATGSIRADITDAHLLFDAKVTVPIRHGQVELDDASVEHVGPDSRMGVSRLGLYLDAPNGRSYLYQFPATPLAGVEFEERGALLGPWVSDRGRLHLQPFVEALLRQASGGLGQGLTEQARLLLGRTALAGEVQLGDGVLAAPGVQMRMEGRGDGRNAVKLHSQAVGQGLAVDIAALRVRDAAASSRGAHLAVDEIAGNLAMRLVVDGTRLRFELGLENGRLEAPRLTLARDCG